jgi:endonuclease YncB( thermonuclease family)
VLWALLACAAAASAHALDGMVTAVLDGDTFLLQPSEGGKLVKVRLQGIEAPKLCQPGGPEALQALRDLAQGQQVQVEVHGRSDQGLVLAWAWQHGENLGARMVRGGYAWSYRYRDDPGPYRTEEAAALAAGLGLHAQPGALRPREFLRRHGPCAAKR